MLCKLNRMSSYWDEHETSSSEHGIEDMLDFVRRLNTGQLPAHWHFDAFGDFSLPVEIIRMLFNNEDRPKSTAPWFLEQVLEYDDFPVNDTDDCAICLGTALFIQIYLFIKIQIERLSF